MAARKSNSKSENPNLTGGPKTPKGKATAALNSVKHGISAKGPMLLSQEEAAELEVVVVELEATYQARGPIERHLCQQIGLHIIRQRRLWDYEGLLQRQAELRAVKTEITPDYPNGYLVDLGRQSGGLEQEIGFLANIIAPTERLSTADVADLALRYGSEFLTNSPAPEMMRVGVALSKFGRGEMGSDDTMRAITDRFDTLLRTRDRLTEIDAELSQITAAQAAAEITNSVAIERWQCLINRQLKIAIDQLTKLQGHRAQSAIDITPTSSSSLDKTPVVAIASHQRKRRLAT